MLNFKCGNGKIINYSFQLPMSVLFKNENLTEDMIDILQHFLSIERAVNAVHSVSNGHTAKDRLEGFNMQLGDWHTGVKILEVKNVP